MSDNPVVVRVAPSPTGPPHVGTAYIGLFNLALRRKRGGRFILRIEDTDRARSTPESEAQILSSLSWLKLDADEDPHKGGPAGPYRQSERLEVYQKHTKTLLSQDRAYRCFCTTERLAQVRKERPDLIGYDGTCRNLSPKDVERNLSDGLTHVVRLRVDKEGESRVQDLFRGEIVIPNAQVDDQVLVKSDGFPTYHLAVVVDDHLMGVNHVIRAEEWISSLPKHVILYEAFGWPKPVFAHMPLLRNRDKSKISKRKNPTSITWYRDAGYLPEGLVNFLATLGYSPPPRELAEGENPEIFNIDEMVRDFDLKRIKTSGPIFDLEKLDSFNGVYIRKLSPQACSERLVDFFCHLQSKRAELEAPMGQPVTLKGELKEREEERLAKTAETFAFVDRFAPTAEDILPTLSVVQVRLKTFLDYAGVAGFLFQDEVNPDPAVLVPKKKEVSETRGILDRALAALSDLDPFTAESIDPPLRNLVGETGWKVRDLFMTLRVAVTGSRVSPPLFESMELLGREKTLRRLEGASKKLSG